MATRKKKEQVALPALAELEPELVVEDVEAFAERLVSSDGMFSLRDCFLAATELSVYLTAVRNKSMVLASRYVPGMVRAVGEKAVNGDMEAARFLSDYLGLRVKAPVTQVATQVNVNIPTLKDIIQIDEDGNFADSTKGG